MDQSLRSKLDRITNILFAGGVNNPVTYIEQLSYLIYLKLLDEREGDIERERQLLGSAARTKSLFPEQAGRYRWFQWRFKSGPELRAFLRDEVFPYMASLVQEEAQVAIYFQDARLEVDDANVLKQVVDELDGIQFSKLGTAVKGDIYEYLLQYLATQEGALLGQFRTPRQIRLAMVEMLDPDLGDAMFDPACGTGGFLIDAVEHVLGKYSDHLREMPIYGEEMAGQKTPHARTGEAANPESPNLPQRRR